MEKQWPIRIRVSSKYKKLKLSTISASSDWLLLFRSLLFRQGVNAPLVEKREPIRTRAGNRSRKAECTAYYLREFRLASAFPLSAFTLKCEHALRDYISSELIFCRMIF